MRELDTVFGFAQRSPTVGEGELRVWMKREIIINSDYKMRLMPLWEPRKGTMLQSVTGEDLRPFREAGRTLLPFAEGATIGRGV
jgi:hypothetical protein